MKKQLWQLLYIIVAFCGVLPLVATLVARSQLSATPIAVFNFIAWCFVLTFLLWRNRLKEEVISSAQKLQIRGDFLPLEQLLRVLTGEINRRNDALSLNLIERRIRTRDELARALESIVALSYRLLEAESAELALFDKESSMYHSSFVLGKPFRTSAQAMLSGAAEGEEAEISPDVLVQPISFSGSVLGSLRVALKKGKLPGSGDRQIMQLLAIQGSLAIVNAQFTEQLLRMRTASEESTKAKTGFLANLSHELRGPMGIMMNAVELVLDGLCGPITEDQAETLSMVKQNGNHLLELINDVLDYAKIESGKLVPNPEDVLVDELLKDLVGVVRKQAEAKSHSLRYTPNNDALAVRCDRRHMRQILINLLTNAIKYTPDGGQIEISAERTPGNKIKISVSDTGIGIEASNRSKVFSAFERIENAYSITQVGTGLGMSLTQKMVAANDGQIDFDSEVGRGSVFWIILPAVEARAELAHKEVVEQVDVNGRNDFILLVQREDGERKMLTRYLSHIGFRIAPVSSKLAALEVLRDQKVDIVLIDNNIVDRPGDDVVSAIRETAKARSLPVVLISSRGFIFDIEKYLRAGIDRCLIKPIELHELALSCRNLIDGEYRGEVIDHQELDLTNPADAKKKRKEKLQSTKVSTLDDIFH